VKATQSYDYNVDLPHTASWHAHITFAHVTMPASKCSLEAMVSVHLCQQSRIICVDACALLQSKCSAHITHTLTAGCPSMPSCALSARHREPAHGCSSCGLSDAKVLRLAVCTQNPVRYGRAEGVVTASLSSKCWLQTSHSWTQSWSQPWRDTSCLGWSRQAEVWHGMISRCSRQYVNAATQQV